MKKTESESTTPKKDPQEAASTEKSLQHPTRSQNIVITAIGNGCETAF